MSTGPTSTPRNRAATSRPSTISPTSPRASRTWRPSSGASTAAALTRLRAYAQSLNEGRDRFRQREGLPGCLDVQILDQPAVDHHDALAFDDRRVVRGDDLRCLRE